MLRRQHGAELAQRLFIQARSAEHGGGKADRRRSRSRNDTVIHDGGGARNEMALPGVALSMARQKPGVVGSMRPAVQQAGPRQRQRSTANARQSRATLKLLVEQRADIRRPFGFPQGAADHHQHLGAPIRQFGHAFFNLYRQPALRAKRSDLRRKKRYLQPIKRAANAGNQRVFPIGETGCQYDRHFFSHG